MLRDVGSRFGSSGVRATGNFGDFLGDELALTYRRAPRSVEAVIWGMPAVNYDLIKQAAIHGSKGRREPDRLIGPDCRVGRTRRSPPTLTPST